MRNKIIFTTLLGLLFSIFLSAQSVATQINSTSKGIDRTDTSINKAAASIDNAKNSFQKLGKTIGLRFGKKEKKDSLPKIDSLSGKAIKTNTIYISITGIDYERLKLLEDNVKGISGVSKTSKKFNSANSTIEVYFIGRGDALWDLLPGSLREMFVIKDIDVSLVSLEVVKK